MEAAEIYKRMMRALKLLRVHGERGNAHRIYRLGERWVRTEGTPLGNVEYRKLPKEAQDVLRSELGEIFPQVREVLYFVPPRRDSMQQRGLIVKLSAQNERVNVEAWEDGTFRIVSEDFHPEHHGIRGSVTPQGVEARDPDHEKILQEAYSDLQRRIMELKEGEKYNFEVRYGAVRRRGILPAAHRTRNQDNRGICVFRGTGRGPGRDHAETGHHSEENLRSAREGRPTSKGATPSSIK